MLRDLIGRGCTAVDELNLLRGRLNPLGVSLPEAGPRQEGVSSTEELLAQQAAEDWMNRVEGCRSRKKQERNDSKKASSSLAAGPSTSPPVLTPLTPTTNAERDVLRPRLSGKGIPVHQIARDLRLIRTKTSSATVGGAKDEPILIPGLHDSGLVKAKTLQDGTVYGIEIDNDQFKKLEAVLDRFTRVFTVPFLDQSSIYSVRYPHINQLGGDFINTIFNVDFGSRLPYNMLYLKEGGFVQLFHSSPKRFGAAAFRAMDKYGSELFLSL
jgi:hypothetical protein